jgi:hypothetical protein
MTLAQLERRLAKVERELEELKRTDSNGRPVRDGKWWVEHSGQFAGDPVYAEIVRRGRQYRESLRPKTRKRKR